MINKKNKNLIIVGVIVVVVIAYFLFFKQKEGFEEKKQMWGMMPSKMKLAEIEIKGMEPAPCKFDPIRYADAYPDLKKAFGYNADQLLRHYNEWGAREGRSPCGNLKAMMMKSEGPMMMKSEFKPMMMKSEEPMMMKSEFMVKPMMAKSVMVNDTCKGECPEKLISNSGEFIAVFDPNTGNLSVQHVKGKILWQSNSGNRGQGPYRLFMQMDGNLVIYDRNKKPTWASNTSDQGKGPFRIVMQDDYNLVIYGSKGPIWASRSA